MRLSLVVSRPLMDLFLPRILGCLEMNLEPVRQFCVAVAIMNAVNQKGNNHKPACVGRRRRLYLVWVVGQ